MNIISKSSSKTGVMIKGTLRAVIRILKKDLIAIQDELQKSLDNYTVKTDPDVESGLIITGSRSNSFVNIGLENSLDLLFGLGGNIVSHIGATSDTTPVTAATTKLDPTSDDDVQILPVQSLSRTGRIVSGEATFTNANANFAYRKIGYLSTSTDAGTGLIDVIGGGGSTPYNQSFNLDLTGALTWSATLGIDVEFKAS